MVWDFLSSLFLEDHREFFFSGISQAHPMNPCSTPSSAGTETGMAREPLSHLQDLYLLDEIITFFPRISS